MEAIPTVRDVAMRAGVSPATVSRVLNQPEIVAEDKRTRVLAAVEELKYRPNRTAQGLKVGRFGMVSLVVNDISNPFFAEITRAVEEECAMRDLGVLLSDVANDLDRLLAYLDDLADRGVDGIIVCTGAFLDRPEVVEKLRELVDRRIPVVVSGRQPRSLRVPCVSNDQPDGVRQAVQHLFGQGYREFAFIGDSNSSSIGKQRLRAFSREVEGLGIPKQSCHIMHPDQVGLEGGRAVMASFLETHTHRPGDGLAVLSAGDLFAIGAIRASLDAGLRVPEDVGVVGFDDTEIGRFIEPPLSSVAVDSANIGHLVVDRLFRLLDGESSDGLSIRTACKLVVRRSSTRTSS